MQVKVASPTQAPSVPGATPAPVVLENPGAQIVVGPDGRATVQIPGQPALPLQSQSVLGARRDALSQQLRSVNERRDRLAQELRTARDGADRAGIEERLKFLDKRILNIEGQIEENGRLMSQAALAGVPSSTPRIAAPQPTIGGFRQGQATAMGMAFTFAVMMPMALAAARLMWRRANRPVAPPGWAQAAPRLENLEQAVDTIALEMERVSESQRYLTRVLTEQRQAIGAGNPAWAQGEQFPVPEREPVPVRRSEG